MLKQRKSIKKEDRCIKRNPSFEKVALILSICLVIALYWRWALPGVITLGDVWHANRGIMSEWSLGLWNINGLASYTVTNLPALLLLALQGFLYRISQWDPAIVERLVVFLPLILYLIFSPWYLARIMGYRKIGIAATIIVFNLNTIIFLVAGVTTFALAIAVSPLVIATFIQTVQRTRLRYGILFALAATLQMVYEVRISYVTLFLCCVYLIYFLIISSRKIHLNLWILGKRLFLVALVFLLLSSYWIIPFLFGRVSGGAFVGLPEGYDSAGWVHTLSYWNLLHVLGLQSPWWGQTGVVNPPNPQFLLLPILAFSVFLFSAYKRKRTLLFFGVAALVFSFLAKGSKPPFGEVYIWLFLHFPGFFMFREPGKWWFPVAVSYAVLIGGLADRLISRESITLFSNWLKERFNIFPSVAKISSIALGIGAFFIIFPVQPISTLQYSGIFDPRPVPEESTHIELLLESQPDFFRVLWLPGLYRFGYCSSQHPALQGIEVATGVLSKLTKNNPDPSLYLGRYFSTFLLRLFSVKYVLVPFAPQNEPYIYYWYGRPSKYYRQLVEKTPGLQPVSFKGGSQLYEVPDPLPHLYVSSGSIAVTHDDISSFPAISMIGAVKNAPVILLRDQISKKSLKNVNGLVFRDSNVQDLAIEVARYKLQVTGQSTRVNIEKAGVYEVYFLVSETEEKKIPIFDIKVDGEKKLQVTPISSASGGAAGQAGRKYIKVGDVELKEGKHEVEVIRVSGYQDISRKEIKLVLVNKEEKQKVEKLIWEKINQPGSDLYYIFTKDVEFYVPQGADYAFKAKVSPRLARKKDKIGAEFRFGIEEELKDWFFHPSDVTYDYSVSKDEVLVLSSYFDGGGMEDEFVQMQNRKVRIDLKEYPYFDLVHRIEDSDIQIMEIVAGIDFDKDGKVDEYIRGIYSRPVSLIWDNFSYNLYGKAKGEFPDKTNYDLIHLELYPHKLWGVDCSKLKKQGEYKFWLKSLQFYGYSKEVFFQDVEDALEVKMDSEGELKRWSIKHEDKDYSLESKGKTIAIAEPTSYLELSRPIDKIDISQFTMIELEYKVEDPDRQDIELVFGLDFNGDAVIDKNIFLGYLPATNKDWDKFQIDAYGLIKRIFPVEKEYNLMQITLRLKEYYPFYLKRLRIYSNSLVSPADFVFNRPVLEIDGRKYWLNARFKDKADSRDLWFRQIVHLEKGKHYLDKLADDSFGVEQVVLELVRSSKFKVQSQKEEPEIIFKKINTTKYEVRVNRAREPFWLVFSESFHKQWRLYQLPITGHQLPEFEEIVAEYPELGVKEAKYTMRFAPGDIKYLLKESLDAEHHLVNGYANGWYIDPKELDLPEDFTLALHFWPQSLFYLGLGISGMTLLGCVGYLGSGIVKTKRNRGLGN